MMENTYFEFEKVTKRDVDCGAIAGTLKITEIKDIKNGILEIPEEIDGTPVTYFETYWSSSKPIKKMIISKSLLGIDSIRNFPEIKDELIIDKDNPKWSTDGVNLLSKDGTKLICMCQKNRKSYTIPDGIVTLCEDSFYSSKIVEITIPDSVTTIEKNAFLYCESLKTINGGNNIDQYDWTSFESTKWYDKSPFVTLGTTLVHFNAKDEHVVVPDGITKIGPCAFTTRDLFNAKYMESITLPASLKEIGDYAFTEQVNLKTIYFSEGLESIGTGAFSSCEALTEIVLPLSISKIGARAFGYCKKLRNVVIDHAVSEYDTETKFGVLPENLFCSCEALETFTIPEGTVIIGDNCFDSCENLKYISIPESVTKIGTQAFKNCFDLESLCLPAHCKEVGQEVFPTGQSILTGKRTKFKRIDVDNENTAYKSQDGVLYTFDMKTLIACPAQYSIKEFIVPEGVKEIYPKAFKGCDNITKVVIASTVKTMGDGAFAKMTSLEEVVFPSDFPVVGKSLFDQCSNLKTITWPDNVKEIGEKAFNDTGIEHLVIPDTVESIGKKAFAFIKAKRVRLPKTVKKIDFNVFAGVPEIEVYDTIDSDAKPVVKHKNNKPNGKVGFIGTTQCEPYFSDTGWYEHTIFVRSAENDTLKYSVRMPAGQKAKVQEVYRSSWGKNAQFNFNKIDGIFKELTADAKIDYLFDRLHWQEGISDKMLQTLKQYASKSSKNISARIFKTDAIEDLILLKDFEIIKKSSIDERIEQAAKAKAIQCKAWLLNWKNDNLSAKEKSNKAKYALKINAPTVAELKKIWTNKKGKDGGLTITRYNGKDVDVEVPDRIGKTPVTAIGDGCFSENRNEDQQLFLRTQLSTVIIPDSVKEIGSNAFKECVGLETVKLPEGLKTISNNMLYGCKNLSIEIPKGIEVIQEGAFVGCSMKSIKIPASIEEIHGSAFGEENDSNVNIMPNLETIEVDLESKCFKSIDGVLYSADGKTLIKYPTTKDCEEYVVLDGVTKIAKNAFLGTNRLVRILLPESITIIEDNAFSMSSALKSVQMPASISVLSMAFDGCTSLKEIVVPEGVTELPGKCFKGCSSLVKVTLPDNLQKIGYSAFEGCTSLTDINIPESVRGIGTNAFENCKALQDIKIHRGVLGLGFEIFNGCDNITVHTPFGSRMYTQAKKDGVKVEALPE